MKERFAKLLLGEDMSGGGKGVSSALALSNAITNLAGNIYLPIFGGHLFFNYKKSAEVSDLKSKLRSFDDSSVLYIQNHKMHLKGGRRNHLRAEFIFFILFSSTTIDFNV